MRLRGGMRENAIRKEEKDLHPSNTYATNKSFCETERVICLLQWHTHARVPHKPPMWNKVVKKEWIVLCRIGIG